MYFFHYFSLQYCHSLFLPHQWGVSERFLIASIHASLTLWTIKIFSFKSLTAVRPALIQHLNVVWIQKLSCNSNWKSHQWIDKAYNVINNYHFVDLSINCFIINNWLYADRDKEFNCQTCCTPHTHLDHYKTLVPSICQTIVSIIKMFKMTEISVHLVQNDSVEVRNTADNLHPQNIV